MISTRQLLALGFDKDDIRRLVAAGRLHPLHRGVYAVGHPAISREGRYLAAVLAVGSGAAVSHVAAAALWGFVRDAAGPIDVTVARRARARAGIAVHSVGRLDASEVTRRANVPVTTPARTILDLAAVLPYERLRRAVRQAEVDRRVSHPQLHAVLEAHPNARGAARLKRLLAQGPAPTRSSLEDEVLDLLVAAGVERPEPNGRINGMEVDFLWRERGVVLEVDSREYHGTPSSDALDVEKTERLEDLGLRVIRCEPRAASRRR